MLTKTDIDAIVDIVSRRLMIDTKWGAMSPLTALDKRLKSLGLIMKRNEIKSVIDDALDNAIGVIMIQEAFSKQAIKESYSDAIFHKRWDKEFIIYDWEDNGLVAADAHDKWDKIMNDFNTIFTKTLAKKLESLDI